MTGRKPVYVKPHKSTKHIMGLMLALIDSYNVGNPIEGGKVIRKCESGRCFAAAGMTEPDREHVYLMFPSLLWYGCLECGQQTYFDATKVGCKPDAFYDLPYDLQKLAVTDYEAFRVALTKHNISKGKKGKKHGNNKNRDEKETIGESTVRGEDK